MRKLRNLELSFVCCCLCLFLCAPVYAQQLIKLQGSVVNADTKKGIPQATLALGGEQGGTSCDSQGFFVLLLPASADSIQQIVVSAVGFQSLALPISLRDSLFTFELHADDQQIDAVEVFGKAKYANRNPAVDIIHQVIKHKRSNRMESYPKLQFEQYDKLQMGLVNPTQKFDKLMGSMSFIFENIDSLTVPGQRLLTLYMEEQLSDVYSSKKPSASKKIVKSIARTEFNERYINNPNIQSYMNFLFQEVELYDDNVFLINKLFLSPIADNAPLFYKYFIKDTLTNAQGRFVELHFEPRNKTDLLFSGTLHISLDNRYAVRHAQMNINAEANLNWVNEISLTLDYKPNAEGMMFLDHSDMHIIFGRKGNDAIYGRKTSVLSKYDFKPSFAPSQFQGAPVEILPSATLNRDIADRRPVPLSLAEQQTYTNIQTLNANKTFNTMLALGYLVAQGYYNAHQVEFGPLEYLYSKNNIEGHRLRLGGRTTNLFSEKLFLEGYLAYGTSDQELKYFLRSAISINGKSVATFPAHYLEGTVQHDILDPGRNIGFLRGDSFFQSLRSNRPTKWFATDAYRLRHIIEFGNHVSISTGFRHQQRQTVGDLRMQQAAHPERRLTQLNTNEAELILRWAPQEKFYYRNLIRETIIEKYPVFTLQYRKGIPGFWNAPYAYDAAAAAVSKRFFLNQLGFADITLSAGKIWGDLPYPLLYIPGTESGDDRHTVDYAKMNAMEFAADQYVNFKIEHKMQGFLFNKIPLIKKLKLREIWGARMFYGKLSDTNNPYVNGSAIAFDTDQDGNTITQLLGKDPYWEGKVGIDNIFRLLRVEYVRRLTYSGLPNVDKDTYRVSLHLNF